MEVIAPTTDSPLGLSEVLRVVGSWPADRVLALTRELASSLPTENRLAIARELMLPSGAEGQPAATEGDEPKPLTNERDANSRDPRVQANCPVKRPTQEDIVALRGMIRLPEGWPEDIDAAGIRERRLREKYGL